MFQNLGKAISLLRELRGRSQASIAREAGVGKSQLSKYETGKELPKLDSLEKVLTALRVGYLELFYTLYLIDSKAQTLGEEPWPIMVMRTGSSILNPVAENAFQSVLRGLFELHGLIVQEALGGHLGSVARQPGSPNLDGKRLESGG